MSPTYVLKMDTPMRSVLFSIGRVFPFEKLVLYGARLVALLLLIIVHTSAYSADGDDNPAHGFAVELWGTWTNLSGFYDLRADELDDAIEYYRKRKLPKSGLAKIERLNETCRQKIHEFETIPIGLLESEFTSIELKTLIDLCDTEIGIRYIVERKPIARFSDERTNFSESEIDRFEPVLNSGLVGKFATVSNKIIKKINETADSIIEFRYVLYPGERREIVEQYFPEAVYYGELAPVSTENSLTLLTPPLPSVIAYMAENGIREDAEIKLDLEDGSRRVGDEQLGRTQAGDPRRIGGRAVDYAIRSR